MQHSAEDRHATSSVWNQDNKLAGCHDNEVLKCIHNLRGKSKSKLTYWLVASPLPIPAADRQRDSDSARCITKTQRNSLSIHLMNLLKSHDFDFKLELIKIIEQVVKLDLVQANAARKINSNLDWRCKVDKRGLLVRKSLSQLLPRFLYMTIESF